MSTWHGRLGCVPGRLSLDCLLSEELMDPGPPPRAISTSSTMGCVQEFASVDLDLGVLIVGVEEAQFRQQ